MIPITKGCVLGHSRRSTVRTFFNNFFSTHQNKLKSAAFKFQYFQNILKIMNPSLDLPDEAALTQHLQTQQNQEFAYPEVGSSAGKPPEGYDHDHESTLLGFGDGVFRAATKALCEWAMFPPSWTQIYPSNAPIEKGTVVLVLFRLFGLWWWRNSSRIVYLIDEPARFGFAYGTLPAHIERGEEIFWVELRDDGSVWYSIRAFSKPNRWYVWLAYPLARAYQRKFRRDSFAAMEKKVKSEK